MFYAYNPKVLIVSPIIRVLLLFIIYRYNKKITTSLFLLCHKISPMYLIILKILQLFTNYESQVFKGDLIIIILLLFLSLLIKQIFPVLHFFLSLCLMRIFLHYYLKVFSLSLVTDLQY